MTKYALELAIKYEAKDDDEAARAATWVLNRLTDYAAVREEMGRGPLEIDEIALFDDDFHRAYGVNRQVNFGDEEGEVSASEDEGKDQEGK